MDKIFVAGMELPANFSLSRLFSVGRSRPAGKGEVFYVRVGPGNRRLSTGKVLTHFTNRNSKGN